MRAGQSALGHDLRFVEAPRRSLRVAAQHASQGQGSARAVPAGHVLPAQQGKPEHWFSDAQLRQLHGQRARSSATHSSGRSTAVRTQQSCTTGIRRPGNSIAGEYRYVSLGGSGNLRSDFLNEHPIQYETVDGDQVDQPGRRSFRMNGNMNQSLGGRWYAQAQADYSSDLTVDQLYSTDITRASRRNRSYGGSVSGTTKGLRMTGRYDRNEYFAENGTSSLRGNSPRLTLARPDRLIRGLPIYASLNSEFIMLRQRQYNKDHVISDNDDINRFDIVPSDSLPFQQAAVPDVQHQHAVPQHVLVRQPHARSRRQLRAGDGAHQPAIPRDELPT